MGEVTVQIWVDTPNDEIKLRRSAEPEPATLSRPEDVAATASHVLGDLADEVLAHFGYTDAFRQYVAISGILTGNDSGQDGRHIGEVRKLLADRDQAKAQASTRASQLAWASDPENWVVEFKHQQHAPDVPVRENYVSTHGGDNALPVATLNHFTDVLRNRLAAIVSAVRTAEDDDAAQDAVESLLRAAYDSAVRSSRYRVELRLRPRPGVAFMATPESPALFEEVRVPYLAPETVAEVTQTLPRVQLDEDSARAAGLHSTSTEEGK